MALSAVPNRDDADDDLDTTEAPPTMGQLIRETALLLPGLKMGERTIDNIKVRVSEQPHARDLHAIGGPAHHVETRAVTIKFNRQGRTPTFTLLGEYGEEMQPMVWNIQFSSRPGTPSSTLFDAHQQIPHQNEVDVLQVQRLQSLLKKYRGED